jgi:hypothetical protein
MAERRGLNTKYIISGTKSCKYESADGRPEDCLNNPMKSPENHRPLICDNCPTNSESCQIAQSSLPEIYVAFKQEYFAKNLPNSSNNS